MEMFSQFLPALAGGALIGLSATILLLFTGRIAGISGIVGSLISTLVQRQAPDDPRWRIAFLFGMLVVGLLAASVWPGAFSVGGAFSNGGRPSVGLIVIAGILVGFGTRLGNGCTSGHGVCGLSRLSFRSLAATLAFMGSGIATVTAMRILGELS